MSGHLAWTVFVDREHENLWRDTLGQADIDAWCQAHGWNSRDICSGSVNVYAYRDGHVEVTADLIAYNPDGTPRFCADGLARDTRTALMARSLPEGIGQVIR